MDENGRPLVTYKRISSTQEIVRTNESKYFKAGLTSLLGYDNVVYLLWWKGSKNCFISLSVDLSHLLYVQYVK